MHLEGEWARLVLLPGSCVVSLGGSRVTERVPGETSLSWAQGEGLWAPPAVGRVPESAGTFTDTPRLCAFLPCSFPPPAPLKRHLLAPPRRSCPLPTALGSPPPSLFLRPSPRVPPSPTASCAGDRGSQGWSSVTALSRQANGDTRNRVQGAEAAGATKRPVTCLAPQLGVTSFVYIFQYFPELLQSTSVT